MKFMCLHAGRLAASVFLASPLPTLVVTSTSTSSHSVRFPKHPKLLPWVDVNAQVSECVSSLGPALKPVRLHDPIGTWYYMHHIYICLTSLHVTIKCI